MGHTVEEINGLKRNIAIKKEMIEAFKREENVLMDIIIKRDARIEELESALNEAQDTINAIEAAEYDRQCHMNERSE